MARDVFISYSQPDHTCAFELVARLEAEGINCWVAPRDIAPSADWAAEIMDAISSARVMILGPFARRYAVPTSTRFGATGFPCSS